MTRSTTNITWLGGLAFVLLLLGSLAGIGCDARSAQASAENTPLAPADGQARVEQAIWAYLRTVPAVPNHVPDPIPPVATTNEEVL